MILTKHYGELSITLLQEFESLRLKRDDRTTNFSLTTRGRIILESEKTRWELRNKRTSPKEKSGEK